MEERLKGRLFSRMRRWFVITLSIYGLLWILLIGITWNGHVAQYQAIIKGEFLWHNYAWYFHRGLVGFYVDGERHPLIEGVQNIWILKYAMWKEWQENRMKPIPIPLAPQKEINAREPQGTPIQ